ncbi:hypothetical protein HDU85_001509 [Gaertneriomyces sp. JEL0708]|nr:hypothetical protein HDU85_001509 [Gaertneriomyces sp. JEL0708]
MEHPTDEYGLDLHDPYGTTSYLEDDTTFLGGGVDDDMTGMGMHDDLDPSMFDPKKSGNILDPNKSEAGKMFIGGLNWETTDESMRAYFEKFGEVEDCVVMKDPSTGRSRGFGFLTFKNASSVDEVIQLEHTLDGKIIDPKRAIPREEQDRTEKIFVGGVGPDVTEEQFREYFTQFGKVIDATLMIDRESGRPRGFGFITFENSDGVEKAMLKQSMGGLMINDKAIEVKRAMPKHKIPQGNAMGGKFGRMDMYGMGEARPAGGPMRGRVPPGMGDMAMGMNTRMGGRYPYGYGRYGAGGEGGAAAGFAAGGFGYGMYGRYGGFGMDGYAAAYGRDPAAMAAYYRSYGAAPGYGYGFPGGMYGYGNMYGRYPGYGAAGGREGAGGAGYSGRDGASGSPGRGYGSRGRYDSPGGRRADDEGDSVALAGGDTDTKPIKTERDYDRDRGYGGERGYGGGRGPQSRGHGYHPYAR